MAFFQLFNFKSCSRPWQLVRKEQQMLWNSGLVAGALDWLSQSEEAAYSGGTRITHCRVN